MVRAAITLLFLSAQASLAQHSGHEASPYAGFETRQVTSLSEDDIAELERGGGWGLALPAELKGYPGPAHLLELKDEIPLKAAQVARVQVLYDAMKAEAIPAGQRLIRAEAALDAGFAAGGLSPDGLGALLQEAEAARAALRLVHLSRHLMTTEILTPEQISRYAALRGYAEDPCANVPEGHDATMWRKHNGCG